DFEDTNETYNWTGFDGGAASVIDNPQATGNSSARVTELVKGAGALWAGSALMLDTAIDFSQGEVFTMNVWSASAKPVLLKFEGSAGNAEVTANHAGGSAWESLSFDFTGMTAGLGDVVKVVIIVDLGVEGDGSAAWTFYADDIAQGSGSGGSGGGTGIQGDAYIFHSMNDDSYYFEHWGDTWGTGTVYTDQPSDNTYAKAIELTKSADWGTVIAWGNEPANTVDTSAYTHARFKVKTSTFSQVQVFVQSPSGVDTEVIYNLSGGTDLGNGWVEMEVALPGFTEMSWFALNFIGDSGTVLLADVYFTTQAVVVTGPPQAAPIPPQYSDNEVVVLYSDSLTVDRGISVWNANWWNAPVYAEGDIAGDHFAKYTITDGGVAGGVVGLEYGFEVSPLNAAATTTWNLDLYVEPGITKVTLQLASEDGSATY
ncbi:MAG: hypothetical protein GY753_02815, partial [Gammaproteobacteria bacterium]|nr:hypothetical protein [Gammaproteobacteria bacterium]